MDLYNLAIAKKLAGGGGGVDKRIFEGGLTELIVPEGVTSLRRSFYTMRPELNKVDLPSTITSIELDAFNRSLASANAYMICRAITPPTLLNNGTPTNANFSNASFKYYYVPPESVDAYKSAWVYQSSKIEPIPE